MPKYLLQASYTVEGTRGLLGEGGSSRRKAVEQMMAELGGTVEAFYYAFGGADAYVIAEVPDATTAAAMSLAINSTGAVTLSTVALLTPEEIDEACQRSIGYRPPGG